MTKFEFLFIGAVPFLFLQSAQSHECPMHQEHQREDAIMGFNHEKTVHHFQLKKEGGQIEVRATQGPDQASIHQIRTHLQEISKSFKEGNFNKPKMIHSELPPGSEKMKELRAEIQYHYEELPDGARVRIETKDSDAMKAIHQFLKFQIQEHQTGDALEVKP